MTLTPEEIEELERDFKQHEAEELSFMNDPVTLNFSKVSFVSRSKGKGRKRRCPITVTLYLYHLDPLKRWRSFEKLPLDSYATEVYGHSECFDERESNLERRLVEELPKRAKRKGT